jgi:hypothetical protein
MTTYLELESRISSWCRSRPDILAAIVIGSRGRLSPPPDDYSDLDLILYVSYRWSAENARLAQAEHSPQP